MFDNVRIKSFFFRTIIKRTLIKKCFFFPFQIREQIIIIIYKYSYQNTRNYYYSCWQRFLKNKNKFSDQNKIYKIRPANNNKKKKNLKEFPILYL